MNAHGKTATATNKATPAIKLVTSVKDISKRTDIVVGTLKSAQHEVHVLAVSVLIHVAKHGNIDVLTGFLDKLKENAQAMRNNSLAMWFEKYGAVYYETDKDKGKGWKIAAEKRKPFLDATKDLKAQRAMLDAASNNPFWLLKGQEGVAYTGIDTAKAIASLISQLERDQKKAKEAGLTVDHSALIIDLKRVRAARALGQNETPVHAPGSGDPLDVPVPQYA
ncbi:hypothetical protein HOR96_gp45 [Agrobacterium phage Atu_ph02]|uniref:Uncharacterized protein n=1 Tax=Agrobacterium phage Atu_ph02 TaxID=2024261 RepID=A0A2L0UYZ7_9CAUD|nr:hypothetical protein HOR96_gp45 [Agrobacterium phage Atu_ph02]AUZ94753.1 hypothetical protein [Agrobacterium phage Atu_ph02]